MTPRPRPHGAGRGAAFALGAGLLNALLFGPAVALAFAFGLVYGLMDVLGSRAFEPSRVRQRAGCGARTP
ncbi:hypothetical protein [Streptomyces sp. NPDC085540]|uniref:hypothetical protein n=1 Tax=Streptomyces sp. NPDC085540 TaxID=3365730 RepID=UPI0037CE3677